MAQIKDFQPSVVVGQRPGGTLFVESYVNGQRKQADLLPGSELFQIGEALALVKAHEVKRREEIEAKAQAEREALHEKVYLETARRHGVSIARRFIGGTEPPEVTKAAEPETVAAWRLAGEPRTWTGSKSSEYRKGVLFDLSALD